MSKNFRLTILVILIVLIIIGVVTLRSPGMKSVFSTENTIISTSEQMSALKETLSFARKPKTHTPAPNTQSSSDYIIDYMINVLPEQEAETVYTGIDNSFSEYRLEISNSINTNFK